MGEPISQKHLTSYLGWMRKIDNNRERITRAKNGACFPTMGASDGSQHQPGSGDRMERAIIRAMELEDKLLPINEALRYKMTQIEQAINGLENPDEQEVLTCRYLDGAWNEEDQCNTYNLMPWADVAMWVCGNNDEKDIKRVTRIHGQALLNIAKFTIEDWKENEE